MHFLAGKYCMLDLVFRNTTQVTGVISTKDFFESFVLKTLNVVGVNEDTEVSVSLISPERMRELNKEHRNRDKVTDILSFPLGETFVPGYTVRTLGDIFICPSYAVARAKEENMTIEAKLARLIVHGTLHLLDYDHERSEKEAEEMDRLEQEILNQ